MLTAAADLFVTNRLASFALLAILTGACAALGWRAAMQRRFAVHRRWMSRCYLLLCSAVVLRLMGGLATVSGVSAPWFDPLASWGCWVLPLATYELSLWANRRKSGSVVARNRDERPALVGRQLG